MKRLISTALLVLTYTIINAQNGSLSIQSFGDADGFHHNKVTGICQDRRGFVWMSSWNGLYRYDGSRFTVFRPTQCEGSTNGDDRLDEARADSYGNIWCRSYHHPYMFDTRKAIFTDIGTEIEKQLGRTLNVRRIICTGNEVWLQSDDSVAIRCTAGNREKPLIFSPVSEWRLCSGTISSIKEDKYGRTWIISQQGITIIDSGSLKNRNQTLRIPGDFIAMEEASDGEYYIIAKDGGVKVVDGIKPTVPISSCTLRLRKMALPAACNDIQRALASSDGELALATSGGIMIHRKGKWIDLRYTSGVRKTLRMKRDSHGRYWIVTDNPGIILAEPAKRTVRQLMPPSKGAYKNSRDSWFFHPLPDGDMLMMAQNDGMCRYNNASQRLERLTANDGRPYQPQVGRSFADSEGNLWLFNEPKDVVRISPYKNTINNRNDGFATRGIFRDSHRRIWRSTDDGRLMLYDSLGNFQCFVGADGRRSKTPAGFPTVYSFAETGNGTIWLGTKNKGLFRLEPADNGGFRTTNYCDDGKPMSLKGNDVFALTTDKNGRLWVGTYSRGLFLIENPSAPQIKFRQVKGFPSDFRSNNIRALLCLHNGIMAAGTSNGLITFQINNKQPSAVKAFHNHRKADDRNSLCNNVVMSLFEDSRNRLYIVTPTSGISHAPSDRILSNDIRFQTISTQNGAPSDMPLTVHEDRQNRLWIVHTGGIACLKTDRKTFVNFPFHGDEGNSFMSASGIVPLADGSLLTGTDTGMAQWNPAIWTASVSPRIAVTALTVCGYPRHTDFDFTDTLRLGSSERDITINVAALIPSGSNSVRYASRTDTSSRWTIHGTNAQLSLLNLSPGWHKLQIKSTDNSGVWTDNIRTLHIYVRPTFWETPWATMIYILLAVIIMSTAAGIWAYIYHLRLKLRTRMENIKMRMDFINNVAPELQRTEDNILEQVRQYVDSRIDDEALSVPDIAAHVGMSVAAFRARFKKLTGLSPVDYIRHYRIEYAKSLLRSTDMNVSEVAYKCGFSDPKYFSRVFRTVEGVSPTSFKENDTERQAQ